MKRLVFIAAFLLCISTGMAQEKILLGLGSSHRDNPEYVYGKVKEIHYQTYHITTVDGQIVIGKPFTMVESEGVELNQPWNYYFNEKGQLIQRSFKSDFGDVWTGLFHYENDRIANMYWLKNGIILSRNDFVYLNNGNLEISDFNIGNNELYGKELHEFDKDGYLLKVISHQKVGTPWYITEFTRNPDGTINTLKGIDKEGKIKHNFVDYKYNDHGLFETSLMKILNYKEANIPNGKLEYQYDDHGNWIKSISRGWRLIERKFVYYEPARIKEEIKLAGEELVKYIGKYALSAENILTITKEGEKMFAQATGQDKFEIAPYEMNKFFIKDFEADIVFKLNDLGDVTGLTVIQNGEYQAKKIE